MSSFIDIHDIMEWCEKQKSDGYDKVLIKFIPEMLKEYFEQKEINELYTDLNYIRKDMEIKQKDMEIKQKEYNFIKEKIKEKIQNKICKTKDDIEKLETI